MIGAAKRATAVSLSSYTNCKVPLEAMDRLQRNGWG